MGAEEVERRAKEERERAEAMRAAEEEVRRRKSEVAAFLLEHKFKGGAGDPKKSLFKTNYPLHKAAKRGNAAMVTMLLQEGASALQKNSSGKTAAEIALGVNKQNSHAGVLRILAMSGSQRAAGGA